jgi:hypothetical protein
MPWFVDSFGRMSLASFVFEPTTPLFTGSSLKFNACPLPTLARVGLDYASAGDLTKAVPW